MGILTSLRLIVALKLLLLGKLQKGHEGEGLGAFIM